MDERSAKPKAPIRRFDVFAEYNRRQALDKGMSDDRAKGYGLWVAKVVASGGSRRSLQPRPPAEGREAEEREPEEEEPQQEQEKWHLLSGKPQTDEMFEDEIVERMGRDFYDKVFAPAIEDAYKSGKSYTAIRDTIRREWKP